MSREPFPVRLRPIATSDTDRIHEWASKPEACRYQPWGPNTRDDTKLFVSEAVNAWKVRPQQRWAWAAVDASDLVVGSGEVKRRGHGRAEISYAVHIDLWGRGIGSAIGYQLADWAFTHLRRSGATGSHLRSAQQRLRVGAETSRDDL